MKKTPIIGLAIAVSFCSGFAFKTIITKPSDEQTETKKVTGIGGIFLSVKTQKN